MRSRRRTGGPGTSPITDHTGQEVARITKTWEGLARTLFTTADNYVVQVHRRLEDPLASLVLASALTVDTALKQDDRGSGLTGAPGTRTVDDVRAGRSVSPGSTG